MSRSKKSAKKPAAAAPTAKPASEATGPAPKPIVRAIRVTAEVLEAAKAYKKAKGVSFYQLGFEAISERLARDGYLKANEAVAGTMGAIAHRFEWFYCSAAEKSPLYSSFRPFLAIFLGPHFEWRKGHPGDSKLSHPPHPAPHPSILG